MLGMKNGKKKLCHLSEHLRGKGSKRKGIYLENQPKGMMSIQQPCIHDKMRQRNLPTKGTIST